MRRARAWLAEPDRDALGALVLEGQRATAEVPAMRRGDWEKLLAGLSAADDRRVRAHVEGLVRACRLFAKKIDELSPVDTLPGLGPTSRVALAAVGLTTVADLVWLAPVGWDDFRSPLSLREAVAASPARVVATAIVKSAGIVPIRGRRCVRVILRDRDDDTCTVQAFWFFLAHGVLQACPPGAAVIVTLEVTAEPKKPPRAAHPTIVADDSKARVVRARYPRLGPGQPILRRAIAHAVTSGITPDPVPAAIVAREGMTAVTSLVCAQHAIGGDVPSGATQRAFIERLAWAEAFTRVWERLDVDRKAVSAPSLAASPKLSKKLEEALGFSFTEGQRTAIAEITTELTKSTPMRRLLLGDVGTGKTAVALCAAAQAIAAGRTAAILAPTTVLAEQYLEAVKPLVEVTGARVSFFAAGSERVDDPDLAIGTHALLGAGIALPRLALVIVDEQQRLGVAQRLALVKKGTRPHLLTLSATPIPRTLSLALRGELAMSTLPERPAGRPAVATRKEVDRALAVADVVRTAARGERVFWVVPRIEVRDDDDDELATLAERAAELEAVLEAGRVVTLHGQMKTADKSEAMRRFRTGDATVLVSTTVIEVGVDVPEATLMVIESAERFGLAQLHQLRGRVGRGREPGRAILLHGPDLGDVAKARLDALCTLSAGEDIAKADLELRGAGDLGGVRQHGAEEELVYLDPSIRYPWLERIEDDARTIHETDPKLASSPILRSLVKRLGHAIAVREEAG